MKICLDPGHGGSDRGGRTLGRPEKTLMLTLQAFVWKELADRGHFVCTTRIRDQFVSLTSRAVYANAMDVDAFVSLHANASGNHNARGAWTLHAAPSVNGRRLAANIQRELAKAAAVTNPGAVYPDASPWVDNRRLKVLRHTRAPAVIVEVGFMTNPEDLKLLEKEDYMADLAEAIALGVDGWTNV